jgi:hypothetical protein
MNPPTPGHLLLIRELIEKALEVNAPNVYVILSKTNDNNENPIDCPKKIPVLQAMVVSLKETMKQYYPDSQQQIDNIEVVFKCVSDNQKSPIAPLYDIVNSYSDIPEVDLFMIVGDDRADFLDTIVDCMFFKIPKVHSVHGKILKRAETELYKRLDETKLGALDISTMPKSAFSASFVRKLVQLGLENKFRDVYNPYLDNGAINDLYGLISEGLNKKPLPKKNATVKSPKYKYPIFKGDDQYNNIINVINVKTNKRPATEISNCDCDDDENDCSLIQTAKKGGGKRTTTTKKYRKHKKNTRKYTRKHPRKNTRKPTRKNTRKYSRKRH